MNTRGSSTPAPHDGPTPVVCVSGAFWDEHWGTHQQIASRLSAQRRVLYVERPVSPLSFFTGVSSAPVGRQFWRWLRGGLRTESGALAVLTPPPFLPLRFNRAVNWVNQWIRRRSIKRAMAKLNLQAPVLCIFAPDAGRIAGTLGEAISLYYCVDDWAASYQWWNSASDIRSREAELALKAGLIVATSARLVSKWKLAGRNAVLITNGADVASFKRALDSDLEVPADLREIPAPRIGYVGFVDKRFDTRLYERLAGKRPEWHWVVIGPSMEKHVDLSRLKRMPNVHFLGARSRSTLPAYLKGLDVCTIPYVCNALSESISPLKLFEYLAAGRPVVSTGLPEVEALSDYVRIGRTPGEFEEAIVLSLTRPLAPPPEDFLAENSWDSKADCLWKAISQAAAGVA
jgi:glycosyltransferase involved in cell wall biosynthesis